MDIPRRSSRRRRLIIRGAIALLPIVAVAVATVGLSHLKAAAPTVGRATVWTDAVKRGQMVREVRGAGRLVPLHIRWVTAPVGGRIEQILILPGMAVHADTALLEMANPDLEKSAADAEWQLRSAEAELECRRVGLQNESLDMEASLARLKAQYEEAKLQAEVDDKLFKDDLLSERSWKLSQAKASQLAELIEIEGRRTEIKRASQPAELAMVKARLEQARADCERKASQLASLRVTAGGSGVLDQWQDTVEVGRQVSPGMPLARISGTQTLKASINVPEVQARDVQVGQAARVDIGRTVVNGSVL
jgi:HlyD family secretion protein